MADVNELFLILDDGTGAGEGLSGRQEGEAVGGANGSVGFAFKDNSGQVVLPQLTADGKIPVSGEAAGTELHANATVEGVVGVDTDIAVITGLTVSKLHECTMALGAATKETLWKVQQVDDATTTTLAEFITGAGQYSYDMDLKLSFTTGASGTQSIKLVANQIKGPATDMHGTIKAVESP